MARVIRGAARVVSAAARASAPHEVAEAAIALARERAQLRESATREIGTLALDVARQLVGEAVALDPALLERIVARALSRARHDTAVTVTLHPEDRRALLARIGTPPAGVLLEDDASQSRGGCWVRGTLVSVDARLETTLGTLARAMGVDPPT
ncbi:MAG: FliH/SctL family protein [Sandaracinus sp.]